VSPAQIDTARRLRRDSTDAERRIWYRVRGGRIGGAKFRRQQPIGRYVVDFVCQEAKLIVELDGGQHAQRTAADAARTRWLESQGYRVIRFWNNDVLNNTEGVLAEIMKHVSVSSAPSPPAPLPRGERGVSRSAPRRGSPSPLMGEGWGEGETE
jgi:very-short-patch-repair endonuclease